MATNVLAGFVFPQRARIFYNSGAISASVTTTVTDPAVTGDPMTQRDILGRNARGKTIGSFFCNKASGSSANWATVKVQHSDGAAPGSTTKDESTWVWEDLVTFTGLTTDAATAETVEVTKPIKKFLRLVATRTGGTLTGLEVGYNYLQTGPRANVGTLQGTVS